MFLCMSVIKNDKSPDKLFTHRQPIPYRIVKIKQKITFSLLQRFCSIFNIEQMSAKTQIYNHTFHASKVNNAFTQFTLICTLYLMQIKNKISNTKCFRNILNRNNCHLEWISTTMTKIVTQYTVFLTIHAIIVFITDYSKNKF